MTPRVKRRWLDFAIGMAVMVPLGFMHWWLMPVVAVYGLWNYYDGQTRMELPNE